VPSISDYDERKGPLRALITIGSQESPPRRFITGTDALPPSNRRLSI